MFSKKRFIVCLSLIFVFLFSMVSYAETPVQIPTVSKSFEPCKVIFKDGEKVLLETNVSKGGNIENIPTYDAFGNIIVAWVLNGAKITDLSALTINSDSVLNVWKAPQINYKMHQSYINGNSGKFRPNDNLTRAEFCVILENIFNITDNNLSCTFNDISNSDWYYNVISKIVSSGIMTGYDDGSFRPASSITRAEFISVLCCGLNIKPQRNVYADTENHWAKNQITFAFDSYWLTSNQSTDFRPDDLITRAEAVAIVNSVLGRNASQNVPMLTYYNVMPFYDVNFSDPYYSDIMEATVEHSFTGKGYEETWTGLSYKSSGFEQGVVKIDESYIYIDSNNQICYLPPWSLVNLNDKIYLTNADGTINLSSRGLKEIYGSLYYFKNDGTVLQNSKYGNLYFGVDGRYTSGNTEIDTYVDEALAKCTNSGMTKEQKLHAAYMYLRDNSKYLGRAHFARGSSDFTEECALFMFKNNLKGNCYCFASCFLYMARRLGYQDAYIVSGGVGKNNLNHSWVMINSNIYDVQLEYAHLYQYANKHYYNLYNMPVNKTPFKYYFPN